MVVKNQLSVEIIACSIFREEDGLAMSSRNTRLTRESRAAAPIIYKTLLMAKKMFETFRVEEVKQWVETTFEKESNLVLEYFEIASEDTLQMVETKVENQKCRAFIAVFAGEIRLIDNISLCLSNS